MSYYYDRRPGFFERLFGNISPAVRNLIIINAIMLVATYLVGDAMYEKLALFAFGSPFFKIWQPVTHMFMHGGFWHFLFNMYTLAVFGTVLENIWGSKKFLIFYFVTGLGAALCHNLVLALQIASGNMALMGVPTVGASGAIYGVLLGFAMLYPDAELRLMFFPFFPLKAKWLVIIFGAIELLTGFTAAGDGIAHFAHLGGMLFGWLLIIYWKKQNKLYN